MMYAYRNRNTGDVVDFDGPSRRLEALENWDRIAGEDPAAAEPVADAEPVAADAGQDDEQPPAKAAPKAEWQAYARGRAQDSEEEAAIDGLSKEQLVEKYGA